MQLQEFMNVEPEPIYVTIILVTNFATTVRRGMSMKDPEKATHGHGVLQADQRSQLLLSIIPSVLQILSMFTCSLIFYDETLSLQVQLSDLEVQII